MCVVTRSPCGNPAASHSLCVSARPVGETSHVATLQASATSWRTSSRPIPEPPPVTTAVLPANSFMCAPPWDYCRVSRRATLGQIDIQPIQIIALRWEGWRGNKGGDDDFAARIGGDHCRGVQRAKRLLSLTELPMTEVALQAGFRSPRRFNAVFVEVYRRSPTQVRTFARANGWGPQVG